MNKEKTIKEWLEELPDGYRELALKYYDPNYDTGFFPESDLDHAIAEAFDWRSTPEGFGFWFDVHNWAHGFGELPPLPEEEE